MPPTPDADTRHLTIAEYADLQEPDDVRSELVGGVLVREPRPGFGHGRTQTRLARRLDSHVEEHELGTVATDVGVVLSHDPPTVRGPDVAYFSRERLTESPEGFVETAPDLAVEIVSPSNTVSHIQARVLEYLDAGTRLVWVVDPGSRSAATYRSRDDVRLLGAGDELDGGDVVPGFRVRLDEVLPE